MDPPNSIKATLKAAIITIPLDLHKYLANLPLDHCYGKSKNATAHTSPLTSDHLSCTRRSSDVRYQLCRTAAFGSTLLRYNHLHTFDVAAVFLRPASAGKAVVEITDVKLGAKISTSHFSFIQNDKERLVGHVS